MKLRNKNCWLVLLAIGCLLPFTACKEAKKNNKKEEIADSTTLHQKAKLIVLAGQSNMVGGGNRTNTDLPSAYPNITYINQGFSSGLKRPGAHSFGPEQGIMQQLTRKYPEQDFVLYKYAVGGSSLYDWLPEQDSAKVAEMGHPKFGSLYDSLLKYLPKQLNSQKLDPAAFLWIQGETDARFPRAGEEYFEGFKSLIQSFRKDGGNPNVPVIIGQVNPPAERYPAALAVMAAQSKITTALPNVQMVSLEGISKRDDNLHYNTPGQIEVGNRLGEKLNSILE
ncbi:lysophospholipase L1-like esterase [Flavobacteriaceae bacterium MAR_2009_75]|nr:lysophospholipase L1-like esterase [Flavobacteriaceae bacterium MAR_2009_75]